MKTTTALLVFLALALLCLAVAKPHNEGKRNHVAKRNREHKLNNRVEHGEHHRRDHGGAGQHSSGSSGQGSRNRKDHPAPAHANPHHAGSATTPQGGHKGGASTPSSSTKKDLHLQQITEHNIEKKHEDKQRSGEAVAKHLVTNRVPSDTARHVLTNRTPQVVADPTRNSTPAAKGKNDTKDEISMESERLIHVTPRPPRNHRVNRMHHNRPSGATPATQQDSSHSSSSPAKTHKPPKKYSPKKHGWKKTQRKEKGKDKLKEKRERRDKRNKALHRAIINRKV